MSEENHDRRSTQAQGTFKRFQHLFQHAFNTVVEPNVGGV